MREIKFRAWLKDVGIMLSVYVLDQTGKAGTGKHFEKSKGYSEHNAQFVFNIDDADLMQYTGLKDKNGKEIYESDVITTHTGKSMIIGWSEKFASFVIMRDGWAFQHWFGEACDPGDCEVIGNIYQNPELL